MAKKKIPVMQNTYLECRNTVRRETKNHPADKLGLTP